MTSVYLLYMSPGLHRHTITLAVCETFGLYPLDNSDIYRNQSISPEMEEVKQYIDKGEVIPLHLQQKLILKGIEKAGKDVLLVNAVHDLQWLTGIKWMCETHNLKFGQCLCFTLNDPEQFIEYEMQKGHIPQTAANEAKTRESVLQLIDLYRSRLNILQPAEPGIWKITGLDFSERHDLKAIQAKIKT